ncbi:MAG TPA: hypothetical protein VFX67_07170 [Burkholderiales bacterium]|nr:hypothetical protein [Burkholderiales bacterium]
MERPGIVIEQRNLDGLRAWTHVIYALHAWSVVAGILTPALVLTAFLLGWPSILAVIFNYIKRDDAKGTMYESHFRWQIRTIWIAVPWALAGLVLWMTLLLIPLAIVLWIATGIWVAYRVIRGWITLARNRPI